MYNINCITLLPVESVITPTALFLPSTVIAGPSDDGTFNIISNSSCNSTMLSMITGILTLVIVIPLANVAVNGAWLKSMPPDDQKVLLT